MEPRRLLRRSLAGLLAGACVLPGAALAAGRAVARPAVTQPSPTVTAGGRAEPASLAVKRHGHYYHVSVHNLTWSDWGQASATAKGTFTFQFCIEESCSVSPFYDEPAVVALSGLKSCEGRLSYTVLALSVEAALPDSSFTHYRTSFGPCRARRGR